MAIILDNHLKVDLNIWPILQYDDHGDSNKDMIVLHETVSPDYKGFADIISNSQYLAAKDYGIHAVIDVDGNLGWTCGHRKAIFYHTASSGSKGSGNVNTRAIGIEQVSRVMLDKPDNTSRWKLWMDRDKELAKVAQLCAFLAKREGIPLRYSDGKTPGITTHWQVTKTFGVSGGHTDCWPRHLDGYYPVLRVIRQAEIYYKKWYE